MYILEFLGGLAITSTVFAILVKKIISYWLDKDVQKFKSNIELKSKLEIEKTRYELEKIVTEHQIRFAKLHEERAHIIIEMNENMEFLMNSIQRFVDVFGFSGQPSKDEMRKEVGENIERFTKHYRKNSIYLSDELSKKIKGLSDVLIGSALSFSNLLTYAQDNQQNIDPKKWSDLSKTVNKLVPEIRTSLGSEFRSILGVN